MSEDNKNLPKESAVSKIEMSASEDGWATVGLSRQKAIDKAFDRMTLSEAIREETKFDELSLNDAEIGEMENKIIVMVDLMEGDLTNLREVLPEPTVDSARVEEGADDFIVRVKKAVDELKDLDSRVDVLFTQLPAKAESEMDNNTEIPTEEMDVADFDIDVVEDIETVKIEPNIEIIIPEKAPEIKMKMEEKRKQLAQLKNKNNEFSLKKIFFQKTEKETAGKIEQVEREYEVARAEFVGANIVKALDEQMNLVEQQIWEKTKSVDKLGKAWGKIRDIYKKLGDLNLEKLMDKKPDSWLGKFGARMVSARTAINSALLGVGVMTGGTTAVVLEAPRAAMRFVGTSSLTYDVLQTASRAKEEKNGLLQDLDAVQINVLPQADIMKRMQTIEARAILDGVSLSESKYGELYSRLKNTLESKINEKTKESPVEKTKVIEDFFAKANADLDIKLKDLKLEKNRHKVIAGAAGAMSAAGWVGKTVGKALEATGVSEALKGAIGYAKEEVSEFDMPVKEHVSNWPLEKNEDVELVELPPLVLTPEQVVERVGEAVVHDAEGLTFPIFRDITNHPEHLDNYADEIKGIKQMIVRHGGDSSALNDKEQRLASWLIYKHDFGNAGTKVYDVMEIKKPDTVAVVFDEGRYKLGSVNGSDVENNLNIKSVEKGAEETLPAEFKFNNTAHMLKAIGVEEEVKLELPAEEMNKTVVPTEIITEKSVCSPEETVPILAAEGRYEKMWEEVKNKLVENLHTDKTVPFILPGSAGGSKEFILNVIQKISDTSYLDLTNKNLVELLSHEPDTSSTGVYKAVEDEIFGSLPKEADVLLESYGAGDGAVVLEGGSSAIKFIDPGTGKSFFTYNTGFMFYQNEMGDLMAKKGGVEYFIRPEFKQGELEVVFEKISK